MSTDFGQKVSYWVGQIALGIGSGDVRGAVSNLILSVSGEAYERGVEEGRRREREANDE